MKQIVKIPLISVGEKHQFWICVDGAENFFEGVCIKSNSPFGTYVFIGQIENEDRIQCVSVKGSSVRYEDFIKEIFPTQAICRN